MDDGEQHIAEATADMMSPYLQASPQLPNEPFFEGSFSSTNVDATPVRRRPLRIPENCRATAWNHRTFSGDVLAKGSKLRPSQFKFLLKPEFWRRIEFALRVSLLAILPAAVVAYDPDTTSKWELPGLIPLLAMIVSQPTIGQVTAGVIQVLRAFVLVLVVVYVTIEVDVFAYHPFLGWGAWYFASCFFITVFAYGLVGKISIMLYNALMVILFRGGMTAMYPLYFTRQNLIGCAMGLAAALIPFPRFETTNWQMDIQRSVRAFSAAFGGITPSMWVRRLDRRVNMVAVRNFRNEMEAALERGRAREGVASWELWFARRHAALKYRMEVAQRLLHNLDSMITVLEAVDHDPKSAELWDNCAMFQTVGEHIKGHMADLSLEVESFLEDLLQKKTSADDAAVLRSAERQLEAAFTIARRATIYKIFEICGDRPYDYYPFLAAGSMLFSYSDCIRVLTEVREPDGPAAWSIVRGMLLFPVRDVAALAAELRGIWRGERTMVLRLLTALKLCFTLTSIISLLLYLDVQNPAGGATVVGFVMDSDPSVSVFVGTRHVLGTVFGSVYGFLATSISKSVTELIILITALMMIVAFVKAGGPQWGLVGHYAGFAALTAMVPYVTPNNMIATIQQNVAAVTWLVIVNNVVLPNWPSRSLVKEMAKGISHARGFLTEALLKYQWVVEDRHSTPEEEAGECAVLTAKLHEMRRCLLLQRTLIGAADGEPSLSPRPFPSAAFLQCNADLQRIFTHFSPMVRAMQLQLRRHRNSHMLLTTRLAPEYVAVADLVNTLLRVLEEMITTERVASVEDSVALVSGLQERVKSLEDLAQRSLMEQYRLIKSGEHHNSPVYKVPAAHEVLYIVLRLPAELNRLLLSVAAVREAIIEGF